MGQQSDQGLPSHVSCTASSAVLLDAFVQSLQHSRVLQQKLDCCELQQQESHLKGLRCCPSRCRLPSHCPVLQGRCLCCAAVTAHLFGTLHTVEIGHCSFMSCSSPCRWLDVVCDEQLCGRAINRPHLVGARYGSLYAATNSESRAGLP